MAMNTEYKVDRAGWPAGPWDDEAEDRIDFTTKAGLPGLCLRGSGGAWCGYVAVLPGHRLHGKHYREVRADVHGGLTYSGACRGNICHVPKPGEPDNVHWFGFDCAHSGDLTPLNREFCEFFASYRSASYVRAEVESLARQLEEPPDAE